MTLADKHVAPQGDSPGMDSGHVVLNGVTKRFGDTVGVNDVNLEINRGEFLTLLGPSGSGKTTLLRMVAGLVSPSEGEIWLDGVKINERPTYARNIGMVFQSLALFPHLDVFGNIAFPLWMRKVPKQEIRNRVMEALELVRLPQMARRKLDALSGGQRQRIALARALVYRPSLLLLDEPLAALDQKLREEMEIELIKLHQQIDVTIVNVTHDQKEALRVSDRIGVMNGGNLEQVGTGVELYTNPKTPFVGAFIGNTNSIEGHVEQMASTCTFVAGETATHIPVTSTLVAGSPATLLLRAERLRLTQDPSVAHVGFEGIITLKAFQGNASHFEVDVPRLGTRLRIESFDRDDAVKYSIGDRVCVEWAVDQAIVLPRLREI